MDDEDFAARLVICEQELASLPETEDRLERALAENAALRAELDSTRAALHGVTNSPSWKLTRPLRLLRRAGRSG